MSAVCMKARILRRICVLITIAGLVALARPALAFDTGPHYDLTRDALQDEGFGNTAIQVVQVQNWLTDYYSNSPTSPDKNAFDHLHFDNLTDTNMVRNYWARITINTRNAIQQAARENDPLKALTVLGVSLHAVQDFYTHSNWVETHPRSGGAYRTDTWFTSTPPAGDMSVYTGRYPASNPGPRDHGNYDVGMNHDSYSRPRFDEAYVFGFAATREWVNAVHQWANEVTPGFWNAVRAYNVSGGDRAMLDSDLDAAYRVSEWVAVSGADGHWKGRGSGSLAEFAAYSAKFAASPNSPFVRQFRDKHVYALISAGLEQNSSPGSPPSVPRVGLNRQAVIVRTLSAAEKDDVGLFEPKIDPLGKADFYAVIDVAGQRFTESMQKDKSSVDTAWTTIKFVPVGTGPVPIHYALWDEDGGLLGSDDHCDVHPGGGKRDLDMSFNPSNHALTGDVNGVFDGPNRVCTSSGAKPDKDRAVIRFYVTAAALADPGPPPAALKTMRVTMHPPVVTIKTREREIGKPSDRRGIVTGSTTVSITVTAVDATTNQPLNAEVRLGEQVVGRTGQPFNHTFTVSGTGGYRKPEFVVVMSGYTEAVVPYRVQFDANEL